MNRGNCVFFHKWEIKRSEFVVCNDLLFAIPGSVGVRLGFWLDGWSSDGVGELGGLDFSNLECAEGIDGDDY